MAGFDAGQAVEPLDYDFTKFVDGAKGTVPEPTQAALEAFMRGGRALIAERSKAEADAAKAAKKGETAELSAEQDREFMGQMFDLVAEFSQGTPSRQDLEGLPPRVAVAFFEWLSGQFGDEDDTRPTRAAMNGSRATKTPA